MATYASEITSYKVGFSRTLNKRGLAMLPNHYWNHPYRAFIEIKVAGRWANGITAAILYFMDRKWLIRDDNRDNRLELGFREENRLILNLDFVDFDHSYKIIQSERPLHFLWIEQENNTSENPRADKIVSAWEIATSENEPVGEGPSDA